MKKSSILIILLALVAFGQMAWAQTPVSNETDLRAALNDNNVTYINVIGNITTNSSDELVVGSPKVIDLVGYTITCTGSHFRVASGGSLVIKTEYDGQIIGRASVDGRAIYIESGGSCTIQSGTVKAAVGSVTNGGVIYNAGTLEIEGGTVSNGQATNGGLIYNTGTLSIYGGIITDGNASNGGGIYNNGSLVMSGSPKIYNSTANGSSNNVYLTSGKTITIDGSFTSNANIGVTLADGIGAFTSGYSANNSSTAPSSVFHSDKGSVVILREGEAHLIYWLGSGTVSDPYQIASTGQWNTLAANVNNGITYSGTYFKLMGNIEVTTMVGNHPDGDTYNTFNGTFDGDGHTLTVNLNEYSEFAAPFAYTYGATIKNLITTGTITTSKQHAGGVVGRNGSGKLTLKNVKSNVTINSSYSGSAEHGGLVGYAITADIIGCAFTGSLIGTNSSHCGGLLGYKTHESDQNRKAVFIDCLFSPTSVTVGTDGSYTIANNHTDGVVEITNCYYTQSLGTVQGKRARSISAGENVTVENVSASATVYNVSGITSYGIGFKYNDVLYAGNGDQVVLHLSYSGTIPEFNMVSYFVNGVTLNGNVLNMPNADVVITATVALAIEYELLFTEQKRSFYKFNYPSTNAAGEPITLSSLLAFWKPDAQMTDDVNNSVIINSHYTITADAQCPTRITNTISYDFPDYLLLQALISGRHEYPYEDLISKSVVIMPDYEGYGISSGSTHPYLAEELTAKQVVDGARFGLLVYQELVNGGLAPQLADDWRSFSMGYSQGGAVALAVQRHIEQHNLSDELHFRGTLCGDGPYDLIATLRYYMEDNGTSYDVTTDHRAGQATLPVVLPMILKGMIDSDPAMANYQITDYLTQNFLATGILNWLNSKTVTNKQIVTAWIEQLTNGTTTVNGIAYPAPANMNEMFTQHTVPAYLGTEKAVWVDLSKVFTEGFYNYLSNPSNFNNVPATPDNAYQAMHRALANNNVCTGWEPSHRIMFMHSKKDMVVPYGNYLAFRDAHPEGENVIYRVDTTFSSSDHLVAGTWFLLNMYKRGAYFHWIDTGSFEWDGTGTEDDPWLISTVDEWLLLANRVINGDNYSGKFFKMTNDLSVTSMVGDKTGSSSYATFNGTFDGGGNTLTFNLNEYSEFAAPFAYTYGATIKNLITTGTITTSKQHAGGVVGRNGTGKLTLENVKSDVTINSTFNGSGEHGGLVGYTINADLIGCAFTGSILGENSTGCSGLIGWKTGTTGSSANLTDCLFAPANITVGNTNAYTFVGIPSDGVATFTNCYYTQPLGTEQGMQARSITGGENVTMAFAGDATIYNVSGITRYGTGILYDNMLFAGQGNNVNLSFTVPDGYIIGTVTYTPEGGTAAEMAFDNGVYSFTMPNANVTITVNYSVEWSGDGQSWTTAYLIYTVEQLDLLSARVNSVNSSNYNTKYYKLMADIAYDANVEDNFTAIGATIYDQGEYVFNGHFDGQGYTISGINSIDMVDFYNGLFGHLDSGAEVKNVILANSTIGNGQRCGGIVGQNDGGTITNCHVTSTVTIKGDHIAGYTHGGIVGYNMDGGSISQCTFAGTLTKPISDPTGPAAYYYGGIAGYNYEDASMSDNLVIGATIPSRSYAIPGAIAGCNTGVLARNYYTACNVAGVNNATGVGCNTLSGYNFTQCDITDNDGAIPGTVRTVAAPEVWSSDDPDVSIDGWTFIASPVMEDLIPNNVTGLLGTSIEENSYDYDLYRFNPLADMEWENYHEHTADFVLANGQGYLYAKKDGVTLTFNGSFNLSDTTEVTLQQGFNLVGNTFPRAAYINRPYYTLNQDGTAVLTTSESTVTAISPCYGVVVEATSNSETATFTTTAPVASGLTKNGNLQIALSQPMSNMRGTSTGSATTLDNAIVSFNGGTQLGKFYFGKQNANIYIPQNGKEYAIVCVGRDGACTVSSMPINFKATKDGTYTLTVNPEGVELSYLHLIDNLTGADVDLLHPETLIPQRQNLIAGEAPQSLKPSYTFTAKTTDYESRFKLVFYADEAACEPDVPFAYISNGEIRLLVETTPETSLQIVDMLGRIVVSRRGDVSGNVSTSGMTAGVYVLRLIDGDNVRTQKIVIE